MQDYKDTLNLPKTNFPMKANLSQREPETLKFWDDIDIYGKMQEIRKGKEKFILNDGPPYANGDIHIGHALNKILKDIVVKSKHLSGYDSPFIPGWDCHGLPIEHQVEKKVGKPGEKTDAKTFRKKCREYAQTQIEIQRKSFIRLGVFGDWFNPYISMDFKFEADVIRTLARIISNGHLSKGERPVHWCVNCGSALAEAEVEYQDKESPSIDVLFPVIDDKQFEERFNLSDSNKGNGKIYVVIWTTTPWTLPANEAVACHEKLEYVLAQFDNKRIIVAKELVEQVAARANVENYKILATTAGKNLELLQLQHPFYDRQVPVILGNHVTTDTGTGCVHTAPAHGNEDYVVGLEYNLPIENPVLGNGCFKESTEFFAGLHVYKANDSVLEVLTNKNHLLSSTKINHSYPHCWRHKTPLIFRATPQWFINMDKNGLRKRAIKAIQEEVQWVPKWGQARIEKMVSERPDWCISRQRTWGVPMALFVHKDTGEIHPQTPELMEEVAKLVEQSGIDAWYDLEPEKLLGADAEKYEKINDTLDVWFDSGAVHACVLDKREELHAPADLYLEGSDQHRGWFQTSLLSSVGYRGHAPYKAVLTHGYTVDAAGRKMSKSLGNVVAPDKVIKNLGADILRLWVSTADYSREINVSDEIFNRISDGYRRIRNTARFLLANLHDFDPTEHLIKQEKMLTLDKWIVEQAKKLQQEIINSYDKYQFHVVYQKIHNFCVIELGSFYLDIIKDRQYTCKKNGIPRRSAQTALYYVAESLVRWLAPILSFTAEEIWKFLPGERNESVFFNTWFDRFPEQLTDKEMNDEYWHQILNVRNAINKSLEEARKKNIIGSALEAELELYCNEDLKSILEKLKDELRFVLITSKASVHDIKTKPKDAIDTEYPGLSLTIIASPHTKCERCWHRREDVNKNKEYPNICARCIENLSSDAGEIRAFA